MQKIQIILILSLVYTCQSYQLSQPINDCTPLGGNWIGIYHYFYPHGDQYCMFTTQMNAFSTEQILDTEYTNKMIHSTSNDCEDVIRDLFEAECQYKNGYILETNVEKKYLSGQAKTDYIKLIYGQKSYFFFKGWDMVKTDDSSKFGLKLKQTVEEFNTQGFVGGACTDLNGQWFGKVIFEKEYVNNYHSNALYDVIVNIQSTPRKVQMNIQTTDVNLSGARKYNFTEEYSVTYNTSCDSKKSIMYDTDQTAYGLFTKNFITFDFYRSDISRNYIFFRDQ